MKLPRPPKIGILVGLMIIGLGLVALFATVEVSSTPQFCGSCHIMTPYYESWKSSDHSEIACVECHISPGVTAAIRKKYEGISMVARYVTGTYGTNPWAEVEDSSCLRCHERRLLGVSSEVFGDILFDHQPHLSELRRGKRLRCTSCHSQIVQGSHITVTSTTCILCHFKNQPPGTGTATCTLCHQVPNLIVDTGGIRFDHGDVERFGMTCQSCHTSSLPTDGAVPRERCLTCHNEPDRLEVFEDGDLLHRLHVTDHKVECTNCHLEIQHVAPRHLKAASTECSICHESGHSPQRDLYAGIGGQDVDPMPDVMYLAGVRCEGCHLQSPGEPIRKAGAISCMSCHGSSYNQIYQSWAETIGGRTSSLRRQLDSTARSSGVSSQEGFQLASTNLELVEKGNGIHNVPYSVKLLDTAHRQLNEARVEAGLTTLSTPWPQPPYESTCFACHTGIETVTARPFGRPFSHRPHVVGQGLACESCHSTHEQRRADGMPALLLEPGSCATCHHEQATAESCNKCHGDLSSRTVDSELGDFPHELHVEEMEIACTDCHGEPGSLTREPDLEFCSDCH